MDINIGFGINNDFCQHCACSIASILANANPNDNYNFYIIYNEISEKNISNFYKLKRIKPFNIKFIHINPSEYTKYAKFSSVNQSSFFRFKLFSIKDVDKILYLDSDIIVRKDIKDLFSTNIDKYYIGGAKDILFESLKKQYNLSKNSIYINAGVLLINVKRTREVDMFEKVSAFNTLFKNYQYSDQDIINHAFQEQIAEFDITYNYCFPYKSEYNHDYYYSISQDPSIVHYISNNKPWEPASTCYMKSEYFKYLKLTPYYKDFIDIYRIEENIAILNKLNNLNNKFDNIFIKKQSE